MPSQSSSLGGGGATAALLYNGVDPDGAYYDGTYCQDGRETEGGPVRHARIPKVVSKTFDSSTQACQHCRKRKRKCDRLTPACSNCVKAKIPCIFDLRVTDKTHPGYVEGLIAHNDALNARVAWLERLVAALGVENIRNLETGAVPVLPFNQPEPQQHQLHQPNHHDHHSSPPSNVAVSNNLAHVLTSSTPSAPLLDRYRDTSSFARVTKQILRLQARDSDPTFLVDATPLGRCGPERSPTPPSAAGSSHVQLPDYEDALVMMDAYFNNNGVVYPFLDKSQFKSELEALYQMDDPFPDSPSNTHRQTIFRVFLVLAIGTTNVQQIPGGEAWGASTAYYHRALQELDSMLEKEDIDCVQNLLLLCIFTTYNVDGPSLWATLGSALRLAIGLGLHRRMGADRAPPEELERRRRTWWSIYNFDRVAGFTLVRPLGIADADIDVELPSLDGTGNPFIYYTHHIIRQRRLYGIIIKEVYAVSASSSPSDIATGISARTPAAVLSSIHSLVDTWYRSTPVPLRSTPPGKGHTNRLYFSMAYNLILCALYRPSPLLPTPNKEQLRILRRASERCLEAFWDLHRRRRIAVNHIHLLQVFTSSISLLYCLCEYGTNDRNLQNRQWRRRTTEIVGRCRELLSDFGDGWHGTGKYREIFETLAGILVERCEKEEALGTDSAPFNGDDDGSIDEADDPATTVSVANQTPDPLMMNINSEPGDVMQTLWGGWGEPILEYSTLEYTAMFDDLSPPAMFGTLDSSLFEAEGISPRGIFSSSEDIVMEGQPGRWMDTLLS